MNEPLEQQVDDVVEMESTACPLCGADRTSLLLVGGDLLHGCPGEFQLVRCNDCEHVYLNPRPTISGIGRYYPSNYGPYQAGEKSTSATADGEPKIGLLRRLVRWFVDTKAEFIPPITASPRRALEIGCAHGGFLQRLRSQGWQVRGVEFSPDAAERAASRGLDVHVGTLESAELPDGEFDAVFLWMVLEHLHDPAATLREIRRILKPEGWLMFSVPNYGSWERRFFGRYWCALELPRHLQHYTTRSLKRLLADTGFEIEQVIHQRTANNLVWSFGYWWRSLFPNSKLTPKLIQFCDQPRTWAVILLAIPAKIQAWLRQAGRITVVARVQSRYGESGEKMGGNHQEHEGH